uniref:Mitochondrial splicing suppressor 51-like C-terminal domain-containing protein n=2 Tax=Pseudo-nitzschia australis TaxID=44445 RepID=A0A7S4AIR8_9STRA
MIDVVGVDHVECQNASTIRNTFRPFVRWLRDYFFYGQGRRSVPIHFRLIGRELTAMTMAEGVVVDLLESPTSSMRATATCHYGVYHEFLEERRKQQQQQQQQLQRVEENDQKIENDNDNNNDVPLLSAKMAPDLTIAFNAGVWGYQEWATTFQYLARSKHSSSSVATTTTEAAVETGTRNGDFTGIPIVITAYTLDECQEDQEVISEAIACARSTSTEDANESVSSPFRAEILWESERNPFGSQVVRETKGSNQEYRENSFWQAWLLGGSSASCSS